MSWFTRQHKISLSRAKLVALFALLICAFAVFFLTVVMLILVQLHGEHTMEVAQELLLTHPSCQMCFDISQKIQVHVDTNLKGRASPSRQKALALVKRSLLRDVCGAQTVLPPSPQQSECQGFLTTYTESIVDAAVFAYSVAECEHRDVKISPPPLWNGEINVWEGLLWLVRWGVAGRGRLSEAQLEESYQRSVKDCRAAVKEKAAAATIAAKQLVTEDYRPARVSDFCWDLCFEEPLRMGPNGPTRFVDKLFLLVVRLRSTQAVSRLVGHLMKYGGAVLLLVIVFVLLTVILKLKNSEAVAVYREVVQLVLRGGALHLPQPRNERNSTARRAPSPTSVDVSRKRHR